MTPGMNCITILRIGPAIKWPMKSRLHNVYVGSHGDLYAVDVANQRVQKFVKVK